MAPAMITTHYNPHANSHYGFVPPPSPPMDETSKCSLPSISNLIDLADGGSPTTSEYSHHSQLQAPPSSRPETRPSSSHYNHANSNTSRAAALPPTPPMSSDALFESSGHRSPSTRSVGQLSLASVTNNASNANYYYESSPTSSQVESERSHSAALPRMSVQPSAAFPPSPFSPSYASQPAIASYYPPAQVSTPAVQVQPQVSNLYYQRPLPQTFPPPLPLSVAMMPASGSNPWQHHHYISPSSAAAFPPSQDRYICPTCSKAFSRPSSLRIHSHSHTGEKPFRCPHSGCGKAFSVRSNMKRHERGCHNFESGSPGPTSSSSTTSVASLLS